MNNKMATRLKFMRKQAELTQEQLAARVGVCVYGIVLAECGARASAELAMTLAKYFHVTLGYMIGESIIDAPNGRITEKMGRGNV